MNHHLICPKQVYFFWKLFLRYINKRRSLTLTQFTPRGFLWRVKSSVVRQSKITKGPVSAGLGGKGLMITIVSRKCIIMYICLYLNSSSYQRRFRRWFNKCLFSYYFSPNPGCVNFLSGMKPENLEKPLDFPQTFYNHFHMGSNNLI